MSEFTRFFAARHLRKLHREVPGGIPPLALFNHDLIGRHIVLDGFYEHEHLNALRSEVFPRLPSRGLCLDLGANVGNHAAFLATHFRRVIAFEPNLRAFKLLEANAMLFDNIDCRNFGLSDAAFETMATYDAASVGAASISIDRKGTHSTRFELRRLDDVLTDEEKRDVSFVKIDVEGHELRALTGAAQTLSISRPAIVIEALVSEMVDGSTPAIEYLRGLGYRHLYDFVDVYRGRKVSSRRAKMLNLLNVLSRGRRTLGPLVPEEVTGPLQRRQYAMLLMTAEPMTG